MAWGGFGLLVSGVRVGGGDGWAGGGVAVLGLARVCGGWVWWAQCGRSGPGLASDEEASGGGRGRWKVYSPRKVFAIVK